MSRSTWLTLASLAAIVISLALFIFRPLQTSINRENFDRVLVGMDLADVHALLGPPRDETEGFGGKIFIQTVEVIGLFRNDWKSESDWIVVSYHSDSQKVRSANKVPIDYTNIDYLRWRVRRSFGGGV